MSPNLRKSISLIKSVSITILLTAFASALVAGELSSYRDFRLGMDLSAVKQQADIKSSEPKTIHQRPAVIQDLEWRPRGFPGESEPVKDVLLSFYNGQLFRIVVNYDRYKTEGMTPADMIDAISATYGIATKPSAEILFPSAYSENVKVIARWENSEYSLNLVRSPYQPTFALISFSKQLDSLAQAAAVESIRLDALEAPQRAARQKQMLADAVSAKEEKARVVNKVGFRP